MTAPSRLLINIDVADLETAIAFYHDGLGFDFKRRLFGGAVAEMALGNTEIFLIEREPGSEAVSGLPIVRDYGRHWTPVHLDLIVEDLEAAIERAVKAGAVPPTKTGDYDWGAIAPMADPFGNGFCLLRFKGRGYDGVVVETPTQ